MPESPFDLTKPATVLIEKISDAIGGMAKPFQIVRVAKAEAKATVIRARAQVQVENLNRRAMLRFRSEKARKQANMEQIISDAIPQLEVGSAPQNLADDWITNFFDKCRVVSDQEMQQLWSRLLAAEANHPGKFSRKTVNLVSDLGKADAELFTAVCNFTWWFRAPYSYAAPIIFAGIGEPVHETYSRAGLNFESLTLLNSLGLIQFDAATGFVWNDAANPLHASYFGRVALVPNEAQNLNLGNVIFTRSGSELASVCHSSAVDGFFEFTRGQWAASQGRVPFPFVQTRPAKMPG